MFGFVVRRVRGELDDVIEQSCQANQIDCGNGEHRTELAVGDCRADVRQNVCVVERALIKILLQQRVV